MLQCIDLYRFFGAGNETRTRDPNLGKVIPLELQPIDFKKETG